MTPLAITGLGAVTAFGMGRAAFDAGLDASRAAFTRSPTAFTLGNDTAALLGEVEGFDAKVVLGDKGLRNHDRLTRLALVASRFALTDAQWKTGETFTDGFTAESIGVVASTAYASLEAITELDRVARLEDPRYLNPSRFPNTVSNSAFGYLSIWESLRALNVAVTNGPTGGLDAFGAAALYLGEGRARALLVGGAEALSEALWRAYQRLGMLDVGSSSFAPGDARSPGLRLGEAAVFAAVEPLALATKRGAAVHAVVRGYGSAFGLPDDEAHATLVAPSEDALTRAIVAALDDAHAPADTIDLVVSGMSGYAPHDTIEAAAITAALPRPVKTVAPKALVGETLGAGGAVALATAMHHLARGAASRVLLTSLGYYGNASALLVERAERTP